MKLINNTIVHQASVSRAQREQLNRQKSIMLWFTGLSGSGKSTLANAVAHELHQQGHLTYVLDGDNIRQGLCADLGFSDAARTENIRRIGEAGKLFVDAGIITLSAFISPFGSDRQTVRELLGAADFLEIYCSCSIEVCEARDPKGLYKRVRSGELKNFTGISSPYEIPQHPELTIDTSQQTLEASVAQVLNLLRERSIVLPVSKVADIQITKAG